MARGKSKAELNRIFQRGQSQASSKLGDAPKMARCDVCQHEKRNCKRVGERLICGQCRYDYAQQKESDDAEQARDFMTSLMLGKLAQEEILILALVCQRVPMSLPQWKEATLEGGEKYKELRDRVFTVLLEMGLLKPEARKYAPKRRD